MSYSRELKYLQWPVRQDSVCHWLLDCGRKIEAAMIGVGVEPSRASDVQFLSSDERAMLRSQK